MPQRHPYKIGDIIKLHNGPYCEFLGYSFKYKMPFDMFLVQYIKSNHGVPIACRTRHHIPAHRFREYKYCGKDRRWTLCDWLPVIKKKDDE